MAERVFWLGKAPGVRRGKTKVVLQLGKPWRDRGGYRCDFRIMGLEPRPITQFAGGVDPVQAILLAFDFAAAWLMTTHAYREGRLTFGGAYDLGLSDGHAVQKLQRPDPETEAKLAAFEVESERHHERMKNDPALQRRIAREMAKPRPEPRQPRWPARDVIAERAFDLSRPTGTRGQVEWTRVTLQLAKPLPWETAYCGRYRILGLPGVERIGSISAAVGMDGVQALQLAMAGACTSLMAPPAYREGRLSFLTSYDLGLPVLRAFRPQVRVGRLPRHRRPPPHR
jgi:hypothetical protein